MKKVLAIIPARLQSTRLKEKMSALISGRPLIYYTWRQAKKVPLLDEVIVATDSKKIYQTVKSFGGQAMMTSVRHNTGTERVAEAARKFRGFKPAMVINIQGDEPLLPPQAVTAVIRALGKDKKVVMATAAFPVSKKEALNPHLVKVVIDKAGNALYFSRSLIPHPRKSPLNYLGHIGLYAFQPDFLQKYVRLPASRLEQAERLEQLRVLEGGYQIRVAVGPFQSVGVDTPTDLKKVRRLLKNVRH